MATAIEGLQAVGFSAKFTDSFSIQLSTTSTFILELKFVF